MSAYTTQLLAFADVLARLHSQTGTAADYTASLTTLSTITHNLLTHPLPPRYTILNLALATLQQRLVRHPAAIDWLRLVGFERGEDDGGGRLLLRGEVDRKVVEIAVQVIEGGLEEARRDEEKAAGVKQQLTGSSGETAADVEMRSTLTQEDEDRQLSERLQREENSRNKQPSNKAADTADDEWDGQRESDAELRVQLQADYNISDVRRALGALKQQIQSALASASSSSLSSPPSESDGYAASDAYLASLSLLHKITANLRTGCDKYRTLKLTNATVAAKLAVYPAALDYLRFLGFDEQRDERTTMRLERVDAVRVERAAVILQRVIEAETPSDEEKEHRTLGPVERELRVMEYEPAMLNERLAAREEEPSEAPDMKLLLSVAAEDRRRNEMFARTDAFVTRHKQAELKQRYKRRYSRTLLRVVCQPDNTLVTAYFRPLEKLSALFTLLTPMLQPDKATTFVLRLPPQQKLTVAKDGAKTLQSLGLVPAATLYAGSETEISGATPTRWLRDDVWQQRTPMVAVAVPVAENAAEIAEMKKEDRMAAGGGGGSGGGSELAGRAGGGVFERKGDADDMDDEALERELKRMKAEKAKKRSAAADAAAKRVAR